MRYPYFHGATDGDAYFRWEYQLEQSFEGHDYSDMEKCYYAQLQFTGHASRWWSESNFLRQFYGRKPKAKTWTELKIDMRQRFVPPIYWQRIAEEERIEEERRLRNDRRIRRENMRRQKELEAELKKQDEERKKVDEERKTEADMRSKKEFDLFWADCKKRFAALDAENKLSRAKNTLHAGTYATIKEEIIITSELTCPIVSEVVPENEVVVAVDDVSVDEVDVGSEFQMVEPVVDIPLDIAHKAPHVASIEPPLVCVSPDFSLQVTSVPDVLVHAHVEAIHFVKDVDIVAKSTVSIAHFKDIQASHIYQDPFLVHCTPFDFIGADWFDGHIRLALRQMAIWFTSLIFMVVRHSEGLLTYVRPRLLFDPGGFEDESFRTGRE